MLMYKSNAENFEHLVHLHYMVYFIYIFFIDNRKKKTQQKTSKN